MPKIIAMIPARKGSKSIPGKNYRVIAGQPLILWTVRAACDAAHVDAVYVSTNDERVRDIVETSGFPATVIDRDPQTATDTATTETVMLDFAGKVDFDILVLLQATSPLTTGRDIDRAIDTLHRTGADSVVSCVESKRFFWTLDDVARPVNYDPQSRPMRQDFPGWLMENGAVYVTPRDTLMKYHCRLGEHPATLVMDPRTAVELDEPVDWEIMEMFLKARS